ncbi:hypothetical protein [Clavibacter nebraskensis]|uniref:hypothetical protein n=1 Tax=Clavibacter nebraskensis TaxID=31963 RepID=UPI003F8609AC
MINTVILAVMAKSPRVLEASTKANEYLATAYCFPQKMQDAMDTAKFWAIIIAAGLGAIALITIGIGMLFSGKRHDGGETLKSLGYFIGGTSLIGGASAIVAVFLTIGTTGCTPVPGVS